MAFIKTEPVGDCTESTGTDVLVIKNEAIEIDDSNLWAVKEKEKCGPQGTSSLMPVKSEPVDGSLEERDGCGVMKKDVDEVERGNDLEVPFFVLVKEEPDDETLLDEGTFEPSNSGQGPIADINRLPRDACPALVGLHSQLLNCCQHSNSLGVQNVNPEECLTKNRTHCLYKLSPKNILSVTDCEIPPGIASTFGVEEGINEVIAEEGKIEQSGEMHRTKMEDEKCVGENNGCSLGKDNVCSSMKEQRHPSLNTFSKQIEQSLHDKKIYKCSQCKKTFTKKWRLASHKYTHMTFNCNQCGKTFTKYSYLTKHTQRHTGEKPFKCNQCEKSYFHKGGLVTHMRHHTGEKPFQCNHCGKAFISSCNLTIHMRLHTGEKRFQCNHCGKAFTNNCSLTVHMRLHTGEKPYKCKQCGRAFMNNGNLASHMHTHTGKKPFKCNECGKTFTKNSNLTVHMRQHTGEKPFKCIQCDAAFFRKIQLITHVRQHTGEKPFQCNLCGKAFYLRYILTQHMQTHTNE